MANRHVTVFKHIGIFAGWPANHGHWQWGDEFLVGFLVGRYNRGGMHDIKPPFTKPLARSLDAGETWETIVPSMDFEGTGPLKHSTGLLSHEIIRVCGIYDHGGEHCHNHGAWYCSPNKGHGWDGPFAFNGLNFADLTRVGKQRPQLINTSRTCVLDDLVFLSVGNDYHWGQDRTFCATLDRSVPMFTFKSWVCNDQNRAVMPAVARLPSGRIVCALRRKGNHPTGTYHDWIDAYASDDNAETWHHIAFIGDTGGHNGNPPALIEYQGALFCAYANRGFKHLMLVRSDDGGENWKLHQIVRSSDNSDIGYPRLFKRKNGLACVYYWSDKKGDEQRIECTLIDL